MSRVLGERHRKPHPRRRPQPAQPTTRRCRARPRADRGSSPFWHAIAREYLERWAHHSQIRRALGLGSLADTPFLETGHAIIATVAGAPVVEEIAATRDSDSTWMIGPIMLGGRSQAADILTLGDTAAEITALVDGPTDLVREFAERVGRR